jgi:hypothetical protein
MKSLADNDILYKGSCYQLLDSLIGESRADVGVLGAARFVLRRKIEKAPLFGSRADAIAVLEAFVADAEVIEPTDDEQALAAALELRAQHEGLPFGSGESQLCAVLVSRDVSELLTGDKRAIAALERLLDMESRLGPVGGRVRCLEQLVCRMIDRAGLESVREPICREPHVDRSLTICFSCGNDAPSSDSIRDGLASYIGDVREGAGRILAPEP